MSELSATASLRMIAKGCFTKGDAVTGDRLARIAIELDEEAKQPTIRDYIKANESDWKKCHRKMVNISSLYEFIGESE